MSINLRSIDLNLLVIFEALYATGSSSRAAERLGMSQPAVSNSLGRLRDLIGDPLFVRDARGLKPTLRSHEIIGPVREALASISRQLANGNDFDLTNYKRLFRIIIADPLELIMMPKIVKAITNKAPGVEIECVQATARFAEEVREGSIDIACLSFPVNTADIVIKALTLVDLVIVSRRNHPGIVKPLDAKTFHQLPQMSIGRELRGLTGVDKNLVAKNFARRTPYMAAKIWSMPPLIQHTDLIGFLPRRFAEAIADNFELDIHETPIQLPEQHFYIMWHVNSEQDPGHKWLREAMQEAFLAKDA